MNTWRPSVGRQSRLSRRTLIAAGAGALGLANAGTSVAQPHGPPEGGATPDEALARLMAGNARFVADKNKHPDLGTERRLALATGQHPFATLLDCADSRVAPELIFDQGLGDLFTVRVAGNVVDDAVLGSIEYSVIHLGAPLVMVLGHQRCGAVTAALEAAEGRSSPEDRDTKIGDLVARIAPAVSAIPKDAPDRLDAVILENARLAATNLLKSSAPIRERMIAKRLRVVSARYSLDDGKVTQVLDAA